MKTCRNCKIEYPATTKYFYKYARNKDGLFHTCKACQKAKTKEDRLRREYERSKYGQTLAKYLTDDAEEYQHYKTETNRFKALSEDKEILLGFLHVLRTPNGKYNTDFFPHLRKVTSRGERGVKHN